ncbi:MAG: hypothetical protein ABSF08_14925 [Candidatus Cybelea sp.]
MAGADRARTAPVLVPCDVIVTGGRWEPGAAITFLFPPEVIDITLAGQVLEVDEQGYNGDLC